MISPELALAALNASINLDDPPAESDLPGLSYGERVDALADAIELGRLAIAACVRIQELARGRLNFTVEQMVDALADMERVATTATNGGVKP